MRFGSVRFSFDFFIGLGLASVVVSRLSVLVHFFGFVSSFVAASIRFSFGFGSVLVQVGSLWLRCWNCFLVLFDSIRFGFVTGPFSLRSAKPPATVICCGAHASNAARHDGSELIR